MGDFGRECSPTTHRVRRHQTYHGRVGTNPTNRQHRLTPASRQNLFMPSKPTTSSCYKGPPNSHSTTSSAITCSDSSVRATTSTPTVHYNRITASTNHNANPMFDTTTILNTHMLKHLMPHTSIRASTYFRTNRTEPMTLHVCVTNDHMIS